MRNWIDLFETRLFEMRRGLAPIGEMRAKVFWQPQHSDLIRMLAASKIGDLRGGIVETKEGEVYTAIWPARNLGHWNFFNECHAREGIDYKLHWSLRITRDLETLTEERYWHDETVYRGDGFFCAMTDGLTPDDPKVAKLIGSVKEHSQELTENWNRFPYSYVTCCVDGGHGEGGIAIHDMDEHSSEISFTKFLAETGKEQLAEVFPTYYWAGIAGSRRGIKMKEDYHVRYYKSKWYGIDCVYCVHSAVEYIFTRDGDTPESLGIDREEYCLDLDL